MHSARKTLADAVMHLDEVARRAIPLLDLTSLGDDDNLAVVAALCERARVAGVAAVCVWPRFVAPCREALRGAGIAVATVVNFPAGDGDVAAVEEETCGAIADGADEIDMVLPYRAWLKDDRQLAQKMIAQVRGICGDRVLKVILETGRLRTARAITAASEDAIEAGADFLKTSTGKIGRSATPSAAAAMLRVIRRSARPVGFKASGGIRSVRQAANYLRLADSIMGRGWTTPATFRFGASQLLDACQALAGSDPGG